MRPLARTVLGGALALLVACASLTGASTDEGSEVPLPPRGDADVEDRRDPTAPPGCGDKGGTCAVPAPSGWTGPVAIYDGDPAVVPACPGGTPPTLVAGDGPSGAPATCAACTCAPSTGGTCLVSGSASADGDVQCGAVCAGSGPAPIVNGQCVALPASACGGNAMYRPRFEATVSGASCAKQGGGTVPASKPPITWASATRACQVQAMGREDCREGTTCTSIPPAPFRKRLCVFAIGKTACPGEPYSADVITRYEGDPRDDRGCTDCQCGAANAKCAGTVTGYDPTDCSGSPTVTANVVGGFLCGGVVNPTAGGPNTRSFVVAVSPQAGSCTPSANTPVGGVAVDPTKSVRICCTP